MIRAMNGELVSSVAQDEEIVPSFVDEEGNIKTAGRHKFKFKLISGSVQMSVGIGVGNSVGDRVPTYGTYSSAGDTWEMTASPTDIAEDQAGRNRNIHAKGVATFILTW